MSTDTRIAHQGTAARTHPTRSLQAVACCPAHTAPARQRGATAIEFAFVFPILFLLLYGIVVYAYVFLINESITFVAQESAEAAVAVDPNLNAAYEARVTQQARDTAQRLLQWLPEDQKGRVLGTEGSRVAVTFPSDGPQDLVQIDLAFDLEGLFPVVELPFVGSVPPLPNQLRAQAAALLDPD